MRKFIKLCLFANVLFINIAVAQVERLNQRAFTLIEQEKYNQAGQLFEQVMPIYFENKQFNQYANAYSGLLRVKFEQEKDDEFFSIMRDELPKIKQLVGVQDSVIAKFYLCE